MGEQLARLRQLRDAECKREIRQDPVIQRPIIQAVTWQLFDFRHPKPAEAFIQA